MRLAPWRVQTRPAPGLVSVSTRVAAWLALAARPASRSPYVSGRVTADAHARLNCAMYSIVESYNHRYVECAACSAQREGRASKKLLYRPAERPFSILSPAYDDSRYSTRTESPNRARRNVMGNVLQCCQRPTQRRIPDFDRSGFGRRTGKVGRSLCVRSRAGTGLSGVGCTRNTDHGLTQSANAPTPHRAANARANDRTRGGEVAGGPVRLR